MVGNPPFNPEGKKRGIPAKVTAAALLAERKFGCTATVVVADRDKDDDRAAELESGASRARQIFPTQPVVWGLAIESIEAWTLGAPEAIAEVLEVDVKRVQDLYPRGIGVESLSERSGKPEHRPKELLERIAQLRHRHDSTNFREAVATGTDPQALAKACPLGFGPFVEGLRHTLADR